MTSFSKVVAATYLALVVGATSADETCESNPSLCKIKDGDENVQLQLKRSIQVLSKEDPHESPLSSFGEWQGALWCESKYGDEIGPDEETLAQACLDDPDCKAIWWVPGWSAGKLCSEASFQITKYTTQKVAAKAPEGHHGVFETPQDLMGGGCDGSPIATTSCMTAAQYDEVVNEVENILFSELNQTCDGENCQVADWAGCVLRMAGHDFMDYHNGSGGADGCTDMNEPDNAGLAACLANGEFGHPLKSFYGKFCATVSLADFEVIAAQAVMSLLSTEGEPREALTAGLKANFQYGRTTLTGDDCKHVGHSEENLILPNPALGCSEVDRVFVNNMGLTWEEAAALMGVHSLGRASTSNSGYDGYWMNPENAKKFNNQYYTALIAVSWCPELNVGGNPAKHQWKRCDSGSENFAWKEMMLNTDMCLAYASATGGSLIASPDNEDSMCCGWVHSFFPEEYNMTDVIANNGGSFCNKACSDYGSGACGDASNKKEEFKACCAFEPKNPRRDCMTPGLGEEKFWNEDAKVSAPAAEFVRQFAANRLTWITVFLRAWKQATENGFDGALTPLAETC